ncbi:MAG: hypothetical protein ACOCUF_03175 [Patescibacteria group bacterium]
MGDIGPFEGFDAASGGGKDSVSHKIRHRLDGVGLGKDYGRTQGKKEEKESEREAAEKPGERVFVDSLFFLVDSESKESGKGEERQKGDGAGEEDEALEREEGFEKPGYSPSEGEEFSRGVENIEKKDGRQDFEDEEVVVEAIDFFALLAFVENKEIDARYGQHGSQGENQADSFKIDGEEGEFEEDKKDYEKDGESKIESIFSAGARPGFFIGIVCFFCFFWHICWHIC